MIEEPDVKIIYVDPEKEKELIANIARVARRFADSYYEFDGNPDCVGRDLESLIDATDEWAILVGGLIFPETMNESET
jgi:hypothetical protein